MDDVPEIITIAKEDAGVEGWVAIDTLVRGMSSGGVRVTPDVTAEELHLLARTMTLKYGTLGFPKGGAKAGIRFDPDRDRAELPEALRRFGKAIAPLVESRRFIPAPDMGTDSARIRMVLEGSGCLGRWGESWRWTDSGRFTAAGVAASFFAAADHLRVPPAERSAVVEGTGAVGRNLARFLSERGVSVKAVSNRYGRIYNEAGIDIERWLAFDRDEGPSRIARFPGAGTIGRDESIALPVTAFLPCAVSHTVVEKDAGRFGARMIVSGANNPLAPGARERLEARGVLVLPEFITNTGGILGGALEFAGLPSEQVVKRVFDMVGGAARSLLREAPLSGRSPVVLAREIALERFEKVQRACSSPLLLAGLALRRRGWIPPAISRVLAERYSRMIETRMKDFRR